MEDALWLIGIALSATAISSAARVAIDVIFKRANLREDQLRNDMFREELDRTRALDQAYEDEDDTGRLHVVSDDDPPDAG